MAEHNNKNRICVRCVIDEKVPGADFDEKGVCAFCHLHDLLDKEFPQGEAGKKLLQRIVDKIKTAGRNNQYDCVVGISGGRDSTYLLYLAIKLGLRPLAVHFNDGFGNPIAGQNMLKLTDTLGVDLITITSDWRESKDVRIACLKASIPEPNLGCDLGIATSLYGVASQKNVKYVLIGHSFRTEGVSPIEWNCMDGKYLKSIVRKFGSLDLRQWKPNDPGYHLDLREIFYYLILRRIKTITPLYYVDYVRTEVDKLLLEKFDWVNSGAHYFDDLYQSVVTQVLRVKFKNNDRRIINYSALVRSGQMDREDALKILSKKSRLEDPKIIDLCIKRLGITKQDYEEILALPPKSFRDYPTNYSLIRLFCPVVRIMACLNLVPKSACLKYCP